MKLPWLLLACGIFLLVVIAIRTLSKSQRPQAGDIVREVHSTQITLPSRPGSLRVWSPTLKSPATPRPVVIYSPGWGGADCENTRLCELLADRGFVVLAMDHPPSSTDGRLEDFDLSTEASASAFARGADRELAARTADIRKLLDRLPGLDSGEFGGGQLAGRLDISRVGVVGYSFGGAVAAEATRVDPRLRVGVNLDGSLFGESLISGSMRPFLIVTDNLPPPTEKDLASSDPCTRRLAEFYSSTFRAYDLWEQQFHAKVVRVADAEHADFTDDTSNGNPAAVQRREHIRNVVLDFLQAYLLPEKS